MNFPLLFHFTLFFLLISMGIYADDGTEDGGGRWDFTEHGGGRWDFKEDGVFNLCIYFCFALWKITQYRESK